MTNKENGLIEKFYEIHSKQYAVAKLLSKGHFELKKHMVNTLERRRSERRFIKNK